MMGGRINQIRRKLARLYGSDEQDIVTNPRIMRVSIRKPSIYSKRESNRDSSAGRLPWEERNPRAGLTLPTAPTMPRAGRVTDSLFDTALEGSSEPNLTNRSLLRIKGFLSKGKQRAGECNQS